MLGKIMFNDCCEDVVLKNMAPWIDSLFKKVNMWIDPSLKKKKKTVNGIGPSAYVIRYKDDTTLMAESKEELKSL